MNDIKTWQERMSASGRRECEGLAIELMEAEIAELRAVLASRATPAQQVQSGIGTLLRELKGIAGSRRRSIGQRVTDMVALIETFERKQPSPSGVGAAILALPLPEGMKGTGVATLNGSAWMDFSEPHYTAAQINKLLSEAAELAEQVQVQVQGQQVPKGWRKRLEDMREASYTLSQ